MNNRLIDEGVAEELAGEIIDLQQQRDELLSALKSVKLQLAVNFDEDYESMQHTIINAVHYIDQTLKKMEET